MRIIVLGNSGAGKSTRARRLVAEHDLAHLDLDTVVWEPHQVAVARPTEAVHADLAAFVDAHPRWVIEGSYGDLAEWLAPHATRLEWLDVDVDTCIEHHRNRPWEPHKYDDPGQQDAQRAFLETWVRRYETRDDSFGRAWHQRVFDRFDGDKWRGGTDALEPSQSRLGVIRSRGQV